MGGTGQDLKTEMFLSSWTDISTYVYQRDTVTVQRGRQNEASTMQPGQAGLTLNNRDGRFTTRNPVGAYYPNLVQNTPLRLSVPVADAGLSNYLRLEGDLTSTVTTPDKAGLQITGPIDIRVDCWPSDYSGNVLAAKWGGTAKSWIFGLSTTSLNPGAYGAGGLAFTWFDATFGVLSLPSNLPLPYFGQRICLRVLFTPSTGTAQFFTAPTMAGPFTQLGTNRSVTVATTLNAGVGQAVQIGGQIAPLGGTLVLNSALGMVYEAQILNNVTLEVDPVFSAQTAGVTSFTDSQSSLWTLNGTAEISSRLYRFHGEMGSFPKAADPSGQDVYSQATAYGITKRLQNSNTPLQSAMRRAYVRLPSSLKLAAYWPGEEGSAATSIGSALGGPAMQIAGSPNLASSSAFVCSAPLPVMSGATFTGRVSTPAGFTWTDNVVRFLWAIPLAGEADGATVAQVSCPGGTVASVVMQYHTSGPAISVTGFNSGGTQVATTGNITGIIANGGLFRMGMGVTNTGGGNIALIAESLSVSDVITGGAATPFAGTVGEVTGIIAGSAGITGSAMGHWSVQGVYDFLGDLSGATTAWLGEPAATRIARLCSEEGVACRIKGSQAASMPMWNQGIDTLMNLLQSCENTDLGMLYEPRECLGIGYRTRTSMYHQTPLVTVSYSGGQVFQGFSATGDTQLAVNDVTATSPSGATARQFIAS